MMAIFITIIQALLLALMAPLIAGIIKTAKARMQNRRGPKILQTYYDLYKLLKKDSVISPTVSWVFYVAPYIYFAAALSAAAIIPIYATANIPFADLFMLIYLFGIGRFFLVLASLDAGSTFGGMGGSRELFIAALVEPALLLSMITVALRSNTTELFAMAATTSGTLLSVSHIFAAVAFLIVVLAETGRIPVDNPDTHLELTMIHEGMTLEYSGRYLGLIMWASAIKQMVMILLFCILFMPWQEGLLFKALFTGLLLAAMETSTNKLRLFKLPGLLAVSCLLSLLALVAQ